MSVKGLFAMDLSDLLSPDSIVPALKANSKKQVIQELAGRAASRVHLPERDIFDTLLQRERLGSTGVGHGVAIPHGKLVALDRLVGIFARLQRPVDFDALDDEPVDIIFLLLAPEGAGADHLKALARIARQLRDPTIIAKLRATSDPAALYALLTQPLASNAA
ncbi:PTS system nitrogen regulatory IIA component [Rhodobium orientis]|nr:PTS system nitrogen regulatory IIA component [Rhodobium orientis]